MKTLLILIVLLPAFSFGQEMNEFIRDNSIEIPNAVELNDSLYSRFEDKNLIMIGEMHGTNEPGQLATGITKLITEKEGSVSLGLEIARSEMETFLQNPSEKTLRETRFFSKENEYGMNGKSWFNLIKSCMNDTNIHLFFLNNDREYAADMIKPDSVMYLQVLRQKEKFPDEKIITLTGSVHNKLSVHGDQVTMGYYLNQDSINYKSREIFSINNYYAEGTTLNNRGNGLELRTIEFKESDFTRSVNFDDYLLFLDEKNSTNYHCYWFTREVTHSEALEKAETFKKK
ncbi:MAG: hypothetical protein ACJAUD_000044 [Crocinitomicaceae bacterium]|jgi:hypothetical protein